MKLHAIVLLAAVSAAACSQSTDDPGDDAVGTADVVSMKSPEALARWLGTNHSIKFLGQYLDTRPNAVVPFLDGYNGDGSRPISLVPAKIGEEKVSTILAYGREADATGLTILAKAPPMIRDENTNSLCEQAGVWVEARETVSWSLAEQLASIAKSPEADYTPAERASVSSLAAETTVDVTIDLAGAGTFDREAKSIRLTFGVVKRQLNPETASAPGYFWTLLGAQESTRCTFLYE